MIKIKIPSKKRSGGPAVFMDRLFSYLEERELIRVVDSSPDIYFANVWLDEEIPHGAKLVFRAASAYYNRWERKRSGLNKKIANSVLLANHVIYQSKFSRILITKILNVDAKNSSTIHNGFDTSKYKDVKPISFDKKRVFVACSNWTSAAKRGLEIISCFKESAIKDSLLIIIGPGLPTSISGNVMIVGAKSMEEISAYLKARPYFIHISYVEACPNSVIEALCFGCPVVCNNIGGTPEIVQTSGLIAPCDADFEFRRTKVDINVRFKKHLISAMRNICSRKWKIDRRDLSMENCAKKYMKVFRSVLG